MVYYSKIDLWLVIVLFLGLSPAIVPLFWNFSWVAFAINVVLVVFLVGIFRYTKYVIEDEKLIVKTGFCSRNHATFTKFFLLNVLELV